MLTFRVFNMRWKNWSNFFIFKMLVVSPVFSSHTYRLPGMLPSLGFILLDSLYVYKLMYWNWCNYYGPVQNMSTGRRCSVLLLLLPMAPPLFPPTDSTVAIRTVATGYILPKYTINTHCNKPPSFP